MPIEILRREYFFEGYRGAPRRGNTNLAEQLNKETDPAFAYLKNFKYVPFVHELVAIPDKPDASNVPAISTVVNHNYQHDLESVWWILLWLITMYVDCEASSWTFSRLFSHDVEDFGYRAAFFMSSHGLNFANMLDSDLGDAFPEQLEYLRSEMHKAYILRPIFGQLNNAGSYSQFHELFASILVELKTDKGNWRQMQIGPHKARPMKLPQSSLAPPKRERSSSDGEEPPLSAVPKKKAKFLKATKMGGVSGQANN